MRRTLAVVCALALVASAFAAPVAAQSVAAQSTPTVSVDAPASVEVGSSASGSLVVTDVSDPQGVGSFTVNVTYDPALVSLSARGTSTFDVSTSTPEPGVLRIVGYTGEYPGPTGSVTLATLTVTGEGTGTATLGTAVDSLTDADGDALTHTTSDESLTVTRSGGGSSNTQPDSSDGGSSNPDPAPDSDDGSDSGTATPTATPDSGDTPTATAAETPEPTATPTDEATPTAAATSVPTTSPPAEETLTEMDTATATETGLPGFGVLAALVALLAAALIVRQSRS
ncbi:PGF-CTERM sorting domain-containing protein [Natronomonas sp. EA1]|uniref:cohesin domain-containing protein n=1 Tax=Natronomonas sp. EA1 TaxID=3421655 RepID=UPI003EBD1F32